MHKFILILLLSISHNGLAIRGNSNICLTPIGKIFNFHTKQINHNFRNLNDILMAFTNGFGPDLSEINQRNAFKMYGALRFGDADSGFDIEILNQVIGPLKEFKDLLKVPFREFNIEIQEKKYPVTKELKIYLSSQISSYQKIKNSLFQVDQNKGYWKKILGYQMPEKFKTGPNNNKDHQIDLNKQIREDLDAFLDRRIQPGFRLELTNKNLSITEKSKSLYEYLMKERTRLQKMRKNTKPISQAIIDLMHTIGYHDETILRELKQNPDGPERIKAFRKILKARDEFVEELGYTNSFDQILKTFEIAQPTGIADFKELLVKLKGFEDNIINNVETVSNNTLSKKIRLLSLAESPFRGCIGGTDCSSKIYPLKALDPNYHYFTFTDKNGFSSGQITIVLGEAKLNNRTIKVAFFR